MGGPLPSQYAHCSPGAVGQWLDRAASAVIHLGEAGVLPLVFIGDAGVVRHNQVQIAGPAERTAVARAGSERAVGVPGPSRS